MSMQLKFPVVRNKRFCISFDKSVINKSIYLGKITYFSYPTIVLFLPLALTSSNFLIVSSDDGLVS